MNNKHKIELNEIGYTVIKNLVNKEWVTILRETIEESFIKHKIIQQNNNSEIQNDRVALHALIDNPIFIDFLDFLQKKGFFSFLEENFFKSKCIINSFSALDNIQSQPNFSATVHRDIRFYSKDFPIMINCLLMVDDFTIDNGATYVLPYSHLKEIKPSDDEFFSNAIQIVGKSGDMLIFNSNIWHASAPNKTSNCRRAIPITLSKPFMKQLLDYPRALGYNNIENFNEELQQILGYNSRVPESLDEWYQPANKRFYKKGQD